MGKGGLVAEEFRSGERDVGREVLGIWARLWARGELEMESMNRLLDNRSLFNGHEDLIQDIRCALVPGGAFDDVVAHMRLRGRGESAGELEALGHSDGPASPWLLRRGFEWLLLPQLCEKLQDVNLRQISRSPGASVFSLKAAIDEILLPALELYPEAEPPDAREPILVIGDPEARPECPPLEWLIDGLVLSNATTALIGPPKKAKKTLFALSLAFAVQSGTPFLGHTVKQRRVGVVQHDNPRAIFLDYVDKIQQGNGFPAMRIPYRDGMSNPGFDMAKPAGQKSLCTWIERTGIEVIILDSISGLCPHLNRKNDEENSPLYRGFINPILRDKFGLTVILLSHLSKLGGDTLIGGIDQTAAIDSKLCFNPTEGGIVAIAGEGRHADFKLIVRVMVDEQGGLRLEETAQTAAEDRSDEELLLTFLRGRGEAWTIEREIGRGIGKSGDKTKTLLARALQKGLVEVRQKSPSSRGRPGQEWRIRSSGICDSEGDE